MSVSVSVLKYNHYFFEGNLLPSMLHLKLQFEKADPKLVLTATKPENAQFDIDIATPIISARFYKLAQSRIDHFYSNLVQQDLQLDFPVHPMDYR